MKGEDEKWFDDNEGVLTAVKQAKQPFLSKLW